MASDVMGRVKQGDVKAFEEIYRRYYSSLCSFSYAIIHDHDLVEEVVDDVFFYLWDHRAEIEVTSLENYLLRSVHNRSVNAVNAKSSRVKKRAVPVEEVAQYVNSLFDDSHPLQLLLHEEMDRVVQEAVSSLPVQCRHAFELSRYEHKTYAEIAKDMNVSVNTVKYHIKHALRVLSDSLKDYALCVTILLLSV